MELKDIERIITLLRKRGISVESIDAPRTIAMLKVGDYIKAPVIHIPGETRLAKQLNEVNLAFLIVGDDIYALLDTDYLNMLLEKVGEDI